MKGKIN